jgi:hypothetical protein
MITDIEYADLANRPSRIALMRASLQRLETSISDDEFTVATQPAQEVRSRLQSRINLLSARRDNLRDAIRAAEVRGER